MKTSAEIEKSRILTDLTDLAQNLILGGVSKRQPEILAVGKTLLFAINSVQTESDLASFEQVMTTATAAMKQDQARRADLRDQLEQLGISLN